MGEFNVMLHYKMPDGGPGVETLEQVVVTGGGGLEWESSPWPGMILNISADSVDSYYQSVAAVEVGGRLGGGRPRVVFSGGLPYSIPAHEVPHGSSEAEAKRKLALEMGLDPDLARYYDDSGESPLASWLAVHEHKMVDPAKPIGVVTQPWRMRIERWAGHQVMPSADLVPVEVHNEPDAPRSSEIGPSLVGAVASRLAMVGVRPGDVETVASREHLVDATFGLVVAHSGLGRLLHVGHDRTPSRHFGVDL
jgi:hypothetical protein